jgi:hypothetical protein
MSTKAPLVLGREIRDRLDQLHKLYGREQPLLDILDGLIGRLGHARQLYGPGRSLPTVINGIYALLDELRHLYGSESIEYVLGKFIRRKKLLNRLVNENPPSHCCGGLRIRAAKKRHDPASGGVNPYVLTNKTRRE